MKHAFPFLITALLGTALPAVALDIQFTGTSATAIGGTPGAVVHWLGAGQFLDQGLTIRFQSVETVIDTDLDGDTRWPNEHTVPPLSIWLAVDATSGELAVASPGDLGARSVAFPAAVLDEGELAFDLPRVQLLWVRPGAGAWQGRAVDGGRGDSRASVPGMLAFALADLEPLGHDAVPGELLPGDRLAILDSNRLTLAVLEVTDAWLTEAASQSGSGGSTEKGGR